MASFTHDVGIDPDGEPSCASASETENFAKSPVNFAYRGNGDAAFLFASDPGIAAVVSSGVVAASSSSTVPFSSRSLDLAVGIALFVLTLPLMCLCAVAVRLSGPGPIIFRQKRVGRNGREFTCLKFRTMVDHAELVIDDVLKDNSRAREEWIAIQKLSTDPRVTWLGRFMRRYCLDELPQLFNVMKGEMSIVGPRPIVAAEICRYGSHFPDYCSVNPGLTGLWQVSGSHGLSYDERVFLDASYAKSRSLRLDLTILLKTVPAVLFGGHV